MFQAAGPEKLIPQTPSLVLVLGRTVCQTTSAVILFAATETVETQSFSYCCAYTV